MSDRSRLRLAILRVLVLSLVLTLFGRLWYLQVMAGDEYRQIAASNRLRTVVEPTPRGRLLDVMGRPLVRNRTAMVVTVNKSELDRQEDKGAAVLGRLAQLLAGTPAAMSAAQLAARIAPCTKGGPRPCWNGSPLQPVPVAEDVTPQIAFHIQERREDFAGVDAGLRAVREYPARSIGAHALGYIGPVTEEEVVKGADQGITRTDTIGRSGLEQFYDRELRGRSGVTRLAVRRDESVAGVVEEIDPLPGNDVVLSLDREVQGVVERALADQITKRRTEHDDLGFYPATSGAAIVLEAKTGRVVALASHPTYDPTKFIGGISASDYDALTAAGSGFPLNSRATQGLFAPASTFKLISASAAISLGQANFADTYDCPGEYRLGDVGGRTFQNYDSTDLGRIGLHTALVKSCDTVFYDFAAKEFFADEARIDTKQKPAETLQAMARAYGLGAKTGIDLPSESVGRIPDRSFKQRRWEAQKATYCRRAQTGYPEEPDEARRDFLTRLAKENCSDGFRYVGGDHVNLSIGQGEALVTPLQLAVAYAALANGGTVFSPRLARAVVDPDGHVLREIKPVARGKLPLPAEVIGQIRAALTEVTTSGTAATAFGGFPHHILRVAGKTGTAQVQGKHDTSWFASFAPANDPEFVVVAMVEQAGNGGDVAAPITKLIYEGMYGLNGKRAALPTGHLPAALPTLAPDGSVVAPSPEPVPTGVPAPAIGPQAMPALAPDRRWST